MSASGLDTRSTKSLVTRIKQRTPLSFAESLIIGAAAIRNADAEAATDPEVAYFDTIETWKEGMLTFVNGSPLNRVPGTTEKHVGYVAITVARAVRPQAARRITETLETTGI